ncbi:rhamnulokinase [Agrococcus sp. SGAir0287]|uniref:rhamnulokinase n=1 Tax=Agrococcus sp. SGAir0287 TaxID=2070347 RepID=UPI0010CD0457|nr:rhamnulokinase family protein [Agrococcus sp. SGAir0287]QCR18368.1 rhamnulokinase [Agrococcus sp. SGAir0287]
MSAVHVAAIDLGATSGRVMHAEVGPDVLRLDEVARFENAPVRVGDGLHWSILGLYGAAGAGLGAATRAGRIASVGVDSWGCDYALLRGGAMLGIPFSYRDDRSLRGMALVEQLVPHAELFARNGLQRIPLNTINQLVMDRESGLLAAADGFLHVPDLFGWWLTGRQVAERTIASTSGMLRLDGTWDAELLARLGIDAGILPDVVEPGTRLGPVLASTAEHFGIHGDPEVVAVGSHDTASAVVAAPMEAGGAYISSGTWSLVGVETPAPIVSDAAREAGFTNEAGVDGRTRFLKNVMGMWLLSETLRQWAADGEPAELQPLLDAAAAVDGDVATFDPTDDAFYLPGDMPARIATWLRERGLRVPATRAELVRSILESLATAYADTLRDAERLSGQRIERVHVVGGGSRNALLCRLTAQRLGVPVVAGPVEATALGNVLVQARALGAISGDLEAMRALVRRTTPLTVHEPTA